MSDSKVAIAAAVAGGYLLGRTRKARLALAVASYLAGRHGMATLQRAPHFQELSDQMRGELFQAGRAAVTAAANRRLADLADSLRDRTDALSGR
ncbi:hypothetical protein [Streptomyces sp. NPDC057877]|uniref:hypothetical protein n=1 Tax=Streptomyces sp. NPDC057877 TaxID=3346269 RepID=UPI0036B794AF